MRLAKINETRERLSGVAQALPRGDFSQSVGISFALREREARTNPVKRLIASSVLGVMHSTVQRKLGFELPFNADVVGIGERFVEDAAWSHLLSRLGPMGDLDVLIPGCYMGGEDVQCWLRRGVRRLEGIDVYSLERHWNTIVPALRERWNVPVAFRQGSIEEIPFPDNEFDVLTSAAVLEHVRSISKMVDETARVLKPGGLALHSFGPLYYCYGADHCIAAYGLEAGYDHLLLDEADYRKRIEDRQFFKTSTGNEDLAFWALNDQFSFARAAEYLEIFRTRFDISYLGAKISPEGLSYRDRHPDNWKKLMAAGISEADLLVKGLVAILRKRFEAA